MALLAFPQATAVVAEILASKQADSFQSIGYLN
jgi:hypothetical protein